MDEEAEKFCLRWAEFEQNIIRTFKDLRSDKDFYDVTLVCGEKQVQAHRVILAACSPTFRDMISRSPHHHPVLYLRGIRPNDLVTMLDFMYHGEVMIASEELETFLATAQDLSVRGLAQAGEDEAGEDQEPRNVEEALNDDVENLLRRLEGGEPPEKARKLDARSKVNVKKEPGSTSELTLPPSITKLRIKQEPPSKSSRQNPPTPTEDSVLERVEENREPSSNKRSYDSSRGDYYNQQEEPSRPQVPSTQNYPGLNISTVTEKPQPQEGTQPQRTPEQIPQQHQMSQPQRTSLPQQTPQPQRTSLPPQVPQPDRTSMPQRQPLPQQTQQSQRPMLQHQTQPQRLPHPQQMPDISKQSYSRLDSSTVTSTAKNVSGHGFNVSHQSETAVQQNAGGANYSNNSATPGGSTYSNNSTPGGANYSNNSIPPSQTLRNAPQSSMQGYTSNPSGSANSFSGLSSSTQSLPGSSSSFSGLPTSSQNVQGSSSNFSDLQSSIQSLSSTNMPPHQTNLASAGSGASAPNQNFSEMGTSNVTSRALAYLRTSQQFSHNSSSSSPPVSYSGQASSNAAASAALAASIAECLSAGQEASVAGAVGGAHVRTSTDDIVAKAFDFAQLGTSFNFGNNALSGSSTAGGTMMSPSLSTARTAQSSSRIPSKPPAEIFNPRPTYTLAYDQDSATRPPSSTRLTSESDSQGSETEGLSDPESYLEKVQTPEGPKLRCKVCHKMGSSKGKAQLITHVESVHLNSSIECHVCNKIFKAKSYLKKHQARGKCCNNVINQFPT